MINQVHRFVGTLQSSKVLEKNFDYHTPYMKSTMKETTRQYLQHFYQPYNEELAELMGRQWYATYVGEDWTQTG